MVRGLKGVHLDGAQGAANPCIQFNEEAMKMLLLHCLTDDTIALGVGLMLVGVGLILIAFGIELLREVW